MSPNSNSDYNNIEEISRPNENLTIHYGKNKTLKILAGNSKFEQDLGGEFKI